MPKVEHIVPQWRLRGTGETVWFGTPRRFKGQAYIVAAVVEPQKAFVMVGAPDWKKIQAGDRGHGGSWGFVGSGSLMERKMLRTIKRLTEENS